VVKPEWGAKHACQNCGAKFYDLQQVTAVCPSCDTAVPKVPVRASRPRATPKPVKKAPIKATPVEADELEAETDGAIATIEGTDDEVDDAGDDDAGDEAADATTPSDEAAT
jgi:uncharacterized protein (TIGR02300 family)